MMLLNRVLDRIRHRVGQGATAALAVALAVAAGSMATAQPAGADTAPLSQSTVVGIHNAYNPSAYTYLAQSLDAGASMIELDVWDDVFTREWKVSHDSLTSNKNNCVDASSAADLYRGSANKNLGSCLNDVKYWLA